MRKKPIVLLILDGFGLGESGPANAIWEAKKPRLDALVAENSRTMLAASGEDVGLPAGQIGNSEVGHTNIGAGRVVFQDLPRIHNAIADGSFFENEAYLRAIRSAKETGGALHLLGLMSDGGVHSHNSHFWAMLELAKRQGLSRVYLHCFLDGRDVDPQSGLRFIRECDEKCREIGVGHIATVMGRFYAMDRDSRWERIETAWRAMVLGEGKLCEAAQGVEESYLANVTDEFMKPVVCDGTGLIRSGDSVVFMNFRPDRARELTRALNDREFSHFDRSGGPENLCYVCTTQYDETLEHVSVAFPPEELTDTLGEVLSRNGLRQFRIAETEKYAHVTFFFNGGEEKTFPGEDRLLVPSPREVETYDLVPEMSARKVALEAAERIRSGDYDVIIINLANCDMVGHTGVFDAAVKAVETVDRCVGTIADAVKEMGGITLITADHGNADCMVNENGYPNTAHTTNPVPFLVVGETLRLRGGRLADIAPTILELMGLEKPAAMTGESLIERA